jgi:hypothetical protein
VYALSWALLLAARAGCADPLYGEAAPADAAYVRFFAAVSLDPRGPLEVGAARFEPPARGSATAYRPVAPDIYMVDAGGRSVELIPRARRYYTLAVVAGGLVVFEDTAHTDPSRAQLVLYNLSALDSVGLETEDGRTTVIPPLSAARSRSVVVNAVSVRLRVSGAGSVIGELGDVGLRRGASHSVFVYESGPREASRPARPSTAVVEASLETD